MKTRSSLFVLFVVTALVLGAHVAVLRPATEMPAEPEYVRAEPTAPAPSTDKAGEAIAEQSVVDSIGFPVDG